MTTDTPFVVIVDEFIAGPLRPNPTALSKSSQLSEWERPASLGDA